MLNLTPETKQDFLRQAMARVGALASKEDDREFLLAGLQQLLEESLSQRNFNFEEIADHLYDGVYLADGTGMTLYVNKAYERITGLAAHEVIGRRVQDLMADGVYTNAVTPEVLRLKRRVDSVGQSTRNGVRMLITGNPIFDQNGNIKLVAIIEREITEIDAMIIELEATKGKIRSPDTIDFQYRKAFDQGSIAYTGAKLIGESRQILEVLALTRRVADFDVTVLIQGETGVGKEIVANEIHESSSRRDKPFVRVNCAAIPENLLEPELFGYEKGAFTGAAAQGKIGLFELADKGTILLDEIGDMPLELQGKLLRVLQQKELVRVGGTRPIPLDVRVIAATNRDLQALTKIGKFRTDLFFRLNVFPITVPPLRERPNDIAVLSAFFLETYNCKYSKKIRIDHDGLALLCGYAWPGNVRELQNIVERLVLIKDRSSVIGTDCLFPMLHPGESASFAEQMMLFTSLPVSDKPLKTLVEELEKTAIGQALAESGSTRKAAKLLGIDQSTIVKKAKRLGISLSDEKNHR